VWIKRRGNGGGQGRKRKIFFIGKLLLRANNQFVVNERVIEIWRKPAEVEANPHIFPIIP
jgi:hypothetical protein